MIIASRNMVNIHNRMFGIIITASTVIFQCFIKLYVLFTVWQNRQYIYEENIYEDL